MNLPVQLSQLGCLPVRSSSTACSVPYLLSYTERATSPAEASSSNCIDWMQAILLGSYIMLPLNTPGRQRGTGGVVLQEPPTAV